MEEDRETFKSIAPRTMDWEELLEERRREVESGDGRRDDMTGVSAVECLEIREIPGR